MRGLYDEDGIDGPFERRMREAGKPRCTSVSRRGLRCGLERGHTGRHAALRPNGAVYFDDPRQEDAPWPKP